MTQTLQQLINSSLLFTKEDGTQEFVHDNIRDFFLAYWFAYQINSGKLSVEVAYRNHWSYVEDNAFWGLDPSFEWRSILPAWWNILLKLSNMLHPEKLEKLVESGIASFDKFNQDKLDAILPVYHPFLYDFAGLCCLSGEGQVGEVLQEKLSSSAVKLLSRVGDNMDYLSLLFGALAFSRSKPSYDVLYEYSRWNRQHNLHYTGPDGEAICYSTFIKYYLMAINTAEARDLVESMYKEVADIFGRKYYPSADALMGNASFRSGVVESKFPSVYFRRTSASHGDIDPSKLIDTLSGKFIDFGNHPIHFYDIFEVHQSLKPRGYNPPEKRLAL